MKYGDPDKWTFDCIMEHVDSEIKYLHRRRVHDDDHAIDDMDKAKHDGRKGNFHANMNSAKVGDEGESSAPETPHCIFHKQANHTLAECRKWNKLPVNERRAKCKSFGLCYRCLGKHLIKKCKSDQVCGHNGCGKYHHTSLHPVSEDKERGTNNSGTTQAAMQSDTSEGRYRQFSTMVIFLNF